MVMSLTPELLNEKLVKLADAGRLVPPNGVSLLTVERWIRQGVDGVKLEVCRIGGTRHTSEEAVQRFLEAMNQTPPEAAPADLSGPKRQGRKPMYQKSEEV